MGYREVAQWARSELSDIRQRNVNYRCGNNRQRHKKHQIAHLAPCHRVDVIHACPPSLKRVSRVLKPHRVPEGQVGHLEEETNTEDPEAAESRNGGQVEYEADPVERAKVEDCREEHEHVHAEQASEPYLISLPPERERQEQDANNYADVDVRQVGVQGRSEVV